MAYYGRPSANRGDYYRGDYYRGDPGFFGSLLHAVGGVVGGAVKGLLGGGPIGGIIGAVKGAVGATRQNIATENTMAPESFHAEQQALHARALRGVAPGGAVHVAMLRPGAAGGPRKRRAMNAGNAKALRRALRRAEAFHHMAKRALHLTHPGLHVGGFKLKGSRARKAKVA